MVVGVLILRRGLVDVPGVPFHPRAGDVLIQPVFVLTGAAWAWLRPRNALGWLLIVMGTTNIANVFLSIYGVRAHLVGDPAGDVALAMASWLWYPLVFFLPTLLPLLYPTGHLPSPRWRVAVLATVVGLIAISVPTAFSREALDDFVADPRPLLVLPHVLEVVLAAVGLGLLSVTAVLCVGNALWRLWRARQPERTQLALLLVTATTATLLAFLGGNEPVFLLALAAVPVAVVIGALRYSLLGSRSCSARPCCTGR